MVSRLVVITVLFFSFGTADLLAKKSHKQFNFYADDKLFHRRYTIIKNYLNQYSRPFTAIEVNASADRPFSLPISNDYQCTCLMFGSPDYTEIVQLCKKIQQDNLLIATQKEPYKYFERLTECEHFDVVIIPEVYRSAKKIDKDIFS